MNLVFLGPPGSGKGTQAIRLASKSRLFHLSTGDMLRAAVSGKTELGQKAEDYMTRGELVPDELIIAMIEELVEAGRLDGGFILDGFPRTIPQAEALKDMFAKHGTKLDMTILIQVADEEIHARLRKRADIEGRSDDNDEVVRHRLEVYRDQTAPIVEFYKKEGILTEIKGEGTPDEVFERLVTATA